MKLASVALSMVVALAVTACDEDAPVRDAPGLDDEDTFGENDDDDGDDADGDDGDPDGDGGDGDDDAGDGDGGDSDPTDDDGGDSDPTDDDGDDGDPTDGDTGDPDVDPCDASAYNLAPSGFVSASSVFDPWFGAPYEPELSIDGSTSTSWFSNGPETDGTASVFEWYVQHDHCMDLLVIRNNAEHEEPDFQQGFGFETVVVEVFDTAGDAVYSETHDLGGTPDPELEIALDGILAHRVLLSFSGHESPDCGGFSELIVQGRDEV